MENPLNLEKDNNLDSTLRPKKWEEYVGQEKIKKNLQIIIRAAKERKEVPEHLLFYGNSGLGKTSLAYLVAKEMDSNIKMTSGPAIERAGDLAAILTNLSQGDILFIDEFHRLNKVCEEIIYPVMEDFKLNLVIGKGPMARTMSLDVPPFTLVGATTKMALLSSPVRNRFGATFQLNFYQEKEIEKIIERSSKILDIEARPEAIEIIAKRSRFTPRVANRILKRTRDFAQVEREGIVDKESAEKSLEFLEIDEMGLEMGDRKIIKTIIEKFKGGPVGLQSLAAATSEEENTILDIYEPYLMQIGFIERTSRGRVATKLAYEHLGITYKGNQRLL
jgi:Holliday junction DNA helicase RuvB